MILRVQRSTGSVFIVGAPRSGTSLLYKALCLHPAVGYISNWVRRYPALPQLAALNRAARRLPGLQKAVWFGKDANAYVYSSPRSWLTRAFPMPVEGEPVYTRCGVPQPTSSPALAPEREPHGALPSAFAAIQRYGGGDCMISKRIANNLRIALLTDAFPDARFVEIVRDGRAVAQSLSKVDWWPDSHIWWYGGSPRQWQREGGDPWELCAHHWVREVGAVAEGLAAVPGASVFSIRYERLVRELASVLQDLAGFLGLPENAEWSARLEQLQRPATGKPEYHRLPADALATIERIQSSTLRQLGYKV
ncbi:MAG: sulfotransferase family protein [Egibacteraceae bacterium]